jgi:3-oxoadipate enol-lactonase
MPFLDTASVRLHYLFEQNADRPVLLLSNSLGTSLSMWEPQVARFREHFSLLRMDTRGHGRSSTSSQPFGLADLGRDVLRLIDHLALPKFSFCGLSMGGMIGQWLGVNAAARLDALILSNTAAKIGTPESWNTRIQLATAEGMPSVANVVIERWFTPAFRRDHPEIVERTLNMLRSCDSKGYVECCAAIRDADLRDAIDSITVPTLVIYGTEDPLTTATDAQFLAGHIAGATTLPLRAAHLSNVEAADDFTSGVLNFLLARPGGPSHG